MLFALGGLAFVSVNCFKAIQKAGSRRMHAVMYMWRRPYTVIIVPFAATRTNVLCFHVDIWSNGANGINEDRKGDDIYIPTKTIEVHSE